MAPTAALSPLYQLAHQCGVETTYVDMAGRDRKASPAALLRVLQVLGLPVAKASDAGQALRERIEQEWRRGLEPVHVAWDGEPAHVSLRLPATQARGTMNCQLVLEDGTGHSWSCRLPDLVETGRARLGRRTHVLKRLDLPERLPLGGHHLTVETAGGPFETLLLMAPRRAYQDEAHGRSWGVFLPLYALHTQRSWGCGDFSDLAALLDWTGSMHGRVVGTLPLLAAFVEHPCEPSPYSPVTRLFWNELYLDVSRAPELERCPEARALMRSPEFVEELLLVRDAPLVEYQRVIALKRRVLSLLARALFQGGSERRTVFEEFLRRDPRVEDYAAFRAVQERLRQPWTDWPAPLRDGVAAEGDYDVEAKQYHMYVQWFAAEQMEALSRKARELGTGLYLDLPLGVNAHGYDVWRERQAFAQGVSGGAPPDIVFPRGQNWGFTPLHPERIRADRYRYLRAYVRKQMELAGVLRIDHMPSFHRVFWVPDGMSADEGVYVRYRAEELYALFNLESHRCRTQLVGEDLGTVPAEVPQAMARHGYNRMYVVEYELQPQPERALPAVPANVIASVNTHDMAPFAAYWEGQDIGQRQELGLVGEQATQEARQQHEARRLALEQFLRARGLLEGPADAGTMLQACLRYLASGPAGLLLVNLEDLWLETEPQNVPSTCDECPNWRRKARFALEEIERLPEVRELLEEVNRLRRETQSTPRAEPADEASV